MPDKNSCEGDSQFECPIYLESRSDSRKLHSAVEKFIELIKLFEKRERIIVDYSSYIIADLIRAFSRDIKKLINIDEVATPSEYRVSGLVSFWIRKLKPLQKIISFENDREAEEKNFLEVFFNELFALDVGLAFIDLDKLFADAATIRDDIYNREGADILANLRYRAISPQAMSHFYKMTVQLRSTQEETINHLLVALEYRDDETGNHVRRVSEVSKLLAKAKKMSSSSIQNLNLVAPMHDIGKIAVPDAILKKPGKLTEDERRIIEQHTRLGNEILKGSNTEIITMARNVAFYHHERWDGSGYPNGLEKDNIPIEARIVALADAFDAMRQDRIYRTALPEEQAVDEIKKGSGTQFDPELCELFITNLKIIKEIYKRYE